MHRRLHPIWPPLAAPSSGQPTAGDGVSGKLGTVKRPDGTRQVTLDGRPLYRFAQDSQPGKATGDNATDSFGGQKFNWHAEGDSSSSSSSGGGGSGGQRELRRLAHAEGRARQQRVAVVEEQPGDVTARLQLRVQVPRREAQAAVRQRAQVLTPR